MLLTWRQRLELQPELADLRSWPVIDLSLLPVGHRKMMIRNQSIVAKALAGQNSRSIAAQHGIDRSRVSTLMNRCLGGEDTGEPALTRGLLPYCRLLSGKRRLPLGTLAQPTGASNAFKALLDTVPNLRQTLDAAVRAHVKRSGHGENLTPKSFHALLLRLLREAQWPLDSYPFTHESLAYESARRFLHRTILTCQLRQPNAVRTVRPIRLDKRAYDEIEIDEQHFDAVAHIELVLDGSSLPLRMGRITTILAVDAATDCWLGVQLCLTAHPTQADMLCLLHQINHWTPPELSTPGLAYLPGAGLPAGLGFPYTHAGPGLVRLDNALVHTAGVVRELICSRQGATLNLGLPAHPKGRNVVEHAFDLVSDQARRFPSTTGSHPRDPIREARRNRKRPPRVSLKALEDALRVIATTHNLTPQARLGGQTPLAVLQEHVQNGWARLLPPNAYQQLNPFLVRRAVPVLWRRAENRAPYINFEHVRYQGKCLHDVDLVAEGAHIEFDIRDIRSLKVYRKTGEHIGKVQAPKSWQRFPHSMTTRRYLMRLAKRERLSMIDPLADYFAYQLEHRHKAGCVTEMMRVYREFGAPNGISLKDPALSEPSVETFDEPRFRPASSRVEAWNPNLVLRSRRTKDD